MSSIPAHMPQEFELLLVAEEITQEGSHQWRSEHVFQIASLLLQKVMRRADYHLRKSLPLLPSLHARRCKTHFCRLEGLFFYYYYVFVYLFILVGGKNVIEHQEETRWFWQAFKAPILPAGETSMGLGELRNEEWEGEKACCLQHLSWFSFSLKMYLNSSQHGAGARLSFCHAAYSVFTNPCSPKIFAIRIQLQGTYLFAAILCIFYISSWL